MAFGHTLHGVADDLCWEHIKFCVKSLIFRGRLTKTDGNLSAGFERVAANCESEFDIQVQRSESDQRALIRYGRTHLFEGTKRKEAGELWSKKYAIGKLVQEVWIYWVR